MSIELKMPALSPTMEKGTLAKWLVAVGDRVRPGDLIAEIETDKATMEFEAVDEGAVASIVVAEGTEDVAVGTVIALLSAGGEISDTDQDGPVAEPVSPVRTDPAINGQDGNGATMSLAPVTQPAIEIPTEFSVNASSLARRIAAAKGVNLSSIRGTGARERIVKADLGLVAPMMAAARLAANVQPAPASTYAPPADIPYETFKLSGMRRTISRRLTEAKQTIPHFYLTAKCNLDPMLKLKAELNASLVGRGMKLSVNDMLIKAMAIALQRVPDANVQFGGEELFQFNRVDISMAVAIAGGLITPVIRDAGAQSLSAISQKAKALAGLAREGKLMPEVCQGGTASISNLGMFGIDEMFPVINPPQALILGVGAGIERPWKVDGEIALATVVSLTASFDHRAIDGAIAAQFMAVLRELVEAPLQIVA